MTAQADIRARTEAAITWIESVAKLQLDARQRNLVRLALMAPRPGPYSGNFISTPRRYARPIAGYSMPGTYAIVQRCAAELGWDRPKR